MPPTQVKLLRFEKMSRENSLVFVGRVAKTNATLLFEMKPGWLLHAQEGDLVMLEEFETSLNARNRDEVSFSPLICRPASIGNFGCGLGVPDKPSPKRNMAEDIKAYAYVEPPTKRYRTF